MSKLTKVTIAYLIASLASIITGWVGAYVWAELTQTPVTTGLPSLRAALRCASGTPSPRIWERGWG